MVLLQNPTEADMLVMRYVACADLQDKSVYLYSALVCAILEKDAARLSDVD